MDTAFAPLCQLLDADPAARRRAADQPVWDVERRLLDVGRRVRGLPARDADALLGRALASLVRSGRPTFLEAADAVEPSELGSGPWRQVAPRVWRAPAELAAEVEVAFVVHPDASAWVAAVPAGRSWTDIT